jgi:hypothetical protein
MERLASMMLSIEKRLTLQENERNIANQESRLTTVDIVPERASVPDEPLTMEGQTRSWPDRKTPPQTCQKIIQEAGESEDVIGNSSYNDADKQMKNM